MIKSSLIVITVLLSLSYAVKIQNTQKISIALKSMEEIRLHAGQKTTAGIDGCLEEWTNTNYFGYGERGLGSVSSAAECVQKVKDNCPGFDLANTQINDPSGCWCQKSYGNGNPEDHPQQNAYYRTCRVRLWADVADQEQNSTSSYGSSNYSSSYGNYSSYDNYSSNDVFYPYNSSYGGNSSYDNYSSYGGYYPYNSSYGNYSSNDSYGSPYGGNSSYDSYGSPYGGNSSYSSYGSPYDGNYSYGGYSPYSGNSSYGNYSSYGSPYDSYGGPYGCPCNPSYGGSYNSYGGPYSSPYGSPYGGPYDSYGGPYGSPYGSPYGNNTSNNTTDPYGSPYGSPYGNNTSNNTTDPYDSPYGSPYDSYNTTVPYDSQPEGEDGCLEDWVQTNYFSQDEINLGEVQNAAECVAKAKEECLNYDLVNTQRHNSQNCYCQKSNGESPADHPQTTSYWRTCRIKALETPETPAEPEDSYSYSVTTATSTFEDGCLSDWVTTDAFWPGEIDIGIFGFASVCVNAARSMCPPEYDLVNTQVGDSNNCYCQKSNGGSLSNHTNDTSIWRTCKLR